MKLPPWKEWVLPAVLWSVCASVCLVATRALILTFFSLKVSYDVPAFVQTLFSLPSTFFLIFALSVFIVGRRTSVQRVVLWGVLLLVTIGFVVASHYQSIFGTLPTAHQVSYLGSGSLRSLSGSITQGSLALMVVLEVLGAGVVLFFLSRVLLKNTLQTQTVLSRKFSAIFVFSSFLLSLLAQTIVEQSLSNSHVWFRRQPWAWLTISAVRIYGEASADDAISQDDIVFLQKHLGKKKPYGDALSAYPLCRPKIKTFTPPDPKSNRSAIVVILESVGLPEMKVEVNGKVVMKHLRRIAEENFFFNNVRAAGTKSIQAMTGIFSGLPPQIHSYELHQVPMAHFDGFPGVLKRAGYDTAYFHGADLAFDQQRVFLKQVGFDTISELSNLSDSDVYGWGYADGRTFRTMTEWIHSQRKNYPTKPFLATLFTLSTHHPFLIPSSWPRQFSDAHPKLPYKDDWLSLPTARAPFAESLAYADDVLGKFYDWYLTHEKSKGTVLVVLGDHEGYLRNLRSGETGSMHGFQVPLVIAGVGKGVSERRGAHMDLPATLLGLLGYAPSECDQGSDLRIPDSEWPEDRYVYSVGGEEQEIFQVSTLHGTFTFDRSQRRVLPQLSPTSSLSSDAEKKAHFDEVAEFSNVTSRVMRALKKIRGFYPEESVNRTSEADPLPPTLPMAISHRGNIHGVGSQELNNKENKIEAVADAVKAGYAWTEIDTQVTRDGVVVVRHDPEVRAATGQEVEIGNLTLAQLRNTPRNADVATLEEMVKTFSGKMNFIIEAKPQKIISRELALSRGIVAVIKKYSGKTKFMVDSISPPLAYRIAHLCQCEVALDAPYNEPVDDAWLSAVKKLGLKWVLLRDIQATPAFVQSARKQGIRVIVYEANTEESVTRHEGHYPDGIMTDRQEILEFIRKLRLR